MTRTDRDRDASTPRVAVTGLGQLSALGSNLETFFEDLCQGKRGIAPVHAFDVSGHRSEIAAEVQALAIRQGFNRTDELAFRAAAQALESAALSAADVGLVVGVTAGGMREAEGVVKELGPALDSGAARQFLAHALSATTARLRQALGFSEGSATLCSACSSGAAALALGAEWIRRGRQERVLAGGVDALSRLTFAGFDSLGALDPEPCRPFDARRGGLTLGEGAAILVLESEPAARARGARVLGWLDGWALGSEAHHITQPEPTGKAAARLIRKALAEAGVEPGQVGYVNAHGTGTLHNDHAEALALHLALGAHAATVPVSSSKAQLGHTLGAAGGREAAVTVLALQRGVIPPAVGITTVDPKIDLFLPHEALRAAHCDTFLSNSFGFGGAGAVLAFRHADRADSRLGARVARVFVTGLWSRVGEEGRVGEQHLNLEPGSGVQVGREPLSTLEASQSRRFDWSSATVSLAVREALAQRRLDPSQCGLVAGVGFGDVSRTVAWLGRLFSRGPRAAAPAEFPHLVPSAPAGNASTYNGLRGPVLTTEEHMASADAALHVAATLIASATESAMIAGALEPRDPILTQAFPAWQKELSAWLTLEVDPGTDALAELCAWETIGKGVPTRVAPPSEGERARVLCLANLLPVAEGLWPGIPVQALQLPISPAASGLVLAHAVALIAHGDLDRVLVVSEGDDVYRVTCFAKRGVE